QAERLERMRTMRRGKPPEQRVLTPDVLAPAIQRSLAETNRPHASADRLPLDDDRVDAEMLEEERRRQHGGATTGDDPRCPCRHGIVVPVSRPPVGRAGSRSFHTRLPSARW